MSRLIRSFKLVSSLCVVNYIVSTNWLEDSAKAGYFVPIDSRYELNDADFHNTFGCNIQETIKSPIRQKLFDGKTFYLTPSVNPKIKELSRLIEYCGGKVEKNRRSVTRIIEANTQVPDSYIVICGTNDMHLVFDLFRSGKMNRIVCATELILTSIMKQTFIMDRHQITLKQL